MFNDVFIVVCSPDLIFNNSNNIMSLVPSQSGIKVLWSGEYYVRTKFNKYMVYSWRQSKFLALVETYPESPVYVVCWRNENDKAKRDNGIAQLTVQLTRKGRFWAVDKKNKLYLSYSSYTFTTHQYGTNIYSLQTHVGKYLSAKKNGAITGKVEMLYWYCFVVPL